MLIAPAGLNGIFWPRGDIELARAAQHAGIPFVTSTASNVSIEALADEAGGDLWLQLYELHRVPADQLVDRALRSGYRTLVLTADVALYAANAAGRSAASALVRLLLRHGMPQLQNFASADASNVDEGAASTASKPATQAMARRRRGDCKKQS